PVTVGPRQGGVLRVLGRQDLSNYDLHQVISYLDLQPLRTMYSLLVRPDATDTNKLIPDLAERWEVSPDGKAYTFHLRRGVKFHDGSALTSADVKASFDRQVSPPKGVFSRRQAYFDAVEKIETPDANTVRFVLKRPQAAFPNILSVPFNAIFPKALLDAKGDMKKDIMGTGPFKFKGYDRGVQFEVERNPDYYAPGRPYLDGVVRYMILDASSAKGAFVTGRLDLLTPILPFDLKELEQWKKQAPDTVVTSSPSPAVFAFIPNLTRKPWNDIRVRRAVMLGLDKDALMQLHLPGRGTRGGFMTPGPWAIPQEELFKVPGWGKTTPEDIAQAKKLLAEAGYPDGFTAGHVERNIGEYVDQAVTFKAELAKIGINLELKIMENAAWLALRGTPNFETQGEAAVSVEMAEPDIVFSRYLTGSPGNYAQYSNPKVDELYRQQSQTLDVTERKRLVLEIQRIMMDDLPFMPWAWGSYFAVYGPHVRDFRYAGFFVGYSMEDVWLAK
ncbi:MAG: ABC transporter substrate-binding protein, partial [Chloroflexota bacterium]|nr:ABC transporter substrate-binding protein [Chloroflexota bacterium]